MNARLVAMAKDQKRDVFAVETLGGELAPRVLYLVHPDGKRELVRGAVFDELDNRSLRSAILAAAGVTTTTSQTRWASVPGIRRRSRRACCLGTSG